MSFSCIPLLFSTNINKKNAGLLTVCHPRHQRQYFTSSREKQWIIKTIFSDCFWSIFTKSLKIKMNSFVFSFWNSSILQSSGVSTLPKETRTRHCYYYYQLVVHQCLTLKTPTKCTPKARSNKVFFQNSRLLRQSGQILDG